MDDLDIILDDFLKQFGKELETTKEIISEIVPETQKVQENINLLEEDKNEPENILEAPEILLNEYSKYDALNEEIKVQIEELKLKNPEIFKTLEELNSKILENQNKQSEIKDSIKESMKTYNIKNIHNDFWNVVYVAPYTKTTFDRKAFEKKYPILAKQFITESEVSDSTRWSVYKEKGEK